MKFSPLLLIFGTANLVSGSPVLFKKTGVSVAARAPNAAAPLYLARDSLVRAVHDCLDDWKSWYVDSGLIYKNIPSSPVADPKHAYVGGTNYVMQQVYFSATELTTLLSTVDPAGHGAKRRVRRDESPVLRMRAETASPWYKLECGRQFISDAVNNGMTQFQQLLDNGSLGSQFSSAQISDMRKHIQNARSNAFQAGWEISYLMWTVDSTKEAHPPLPPPY